MSELKVCDVSRSMSPRTISRSPIEAIAPHLERRLQHSTRADLRLVRVSERDGAIRLEGRVHSYYAKQLAQVLARDGNEACRIDNVIDVA